MVSWKQNEGKSEWDGTLAGGDRTQGLTGTQWHVPHWQAVQT